MFNGTREIFQPGAPGKVAPATEAGVIKNAGFLHEILLLNNETSDTNGQKIPRHPVNPV
jgi:hypothetical protein